MNWASRWAAWSAGQVGRHIECQTIYPVRVGVEGEKGGARNKVIKRRKGQEEEELAPSS